MNAPDRPRGINHPLVARMIRKVSQANVWIYRATAGRVGGTLRIGAAFPWGLPLMLLTTTGRKSGVTRTAPLLYLEEGERVICVASQGGTVNDPLWYLNLQANPDCGVQIGARSRRMRARTATADERAALWPRLVAHYADFAAYQARTERVIPVVILDPA
jgi:deazaflavin-dependent oxidoreductase (nitroreductase family)